MVRVVAGGRADQFQSNIAAEPLVPRAKNFSHAARANLFEDPVVPYELADHRNARSAKCTACQRCMGMLGAIPGPVNTTDEVGSWPAGKGNRRCGFSELSVLECVFACMHSEVFE